MHDCHVAWLSHQRLYICNMNDCYAKWLLPYGKYILVTIGRILFRHSFHVPTAKRTQNYPLTLVTWDLISIRPRNRTPDLNACQRITRTVPCQKHVHRQLLCTLSTILPTDTSRRSMAIDSRASIDHYLDDNTEARAEDRKRKKRKRRRMRMSCIIPSSRCVRRIESWFSPGHNISNGILFRSNYTPERFASARASLLLYSTDRRTELNRRRRFFISSASNSGSLSPLSFLWTEWFY